MVSLTGAGTSEHAGNPVPFPGSGLPWGRRMLSVPPVAFLQVADGASLLAAWDSSFIPQRGEGDGAGGASGKGL